MTCCHCKKNDATKSYETIRGGKRVTSYYCLECYRKLVAEENADAPNACPYCGTTLSEFLKSKLVGCAYCYRTLQSTVFSAAWKMQGARGSHCGKTPPTDADESLRVFPFFRADASETEKARFARQCNELELIVQRLQEEGDFAEAKEYADKLSRMKSKSAIEEEFVWGAPLHLSKRP